MHKTELERQFLELTSAKQVRIPHRLTTIHHSYGPRSKEPGISKQTCILYTYVETVLISDQQAYKNKQL